MLVVDWKTDGVVALSVLMWAVTITALLELYRMAGVTGSHRLWGVALVSVLAVGPLVSGGEPAAELEWSAVALALFVLGLFLADWSDRGLTEDIGSLAVPALGLLYVGVCLGFVVRVAQLPGIGVAGVVLLLAVAKGSDISAYYVGTRLGCHRLAPRVSPNKSIEGAVGALLVSVVAALAVVRMCGLPLGVPEAVLFAVLVSVAGQLGDLAESLLKRKLRAKDSARLLPGFGGVLDMVDSLTGAAPAAYILFRLLV